MIKTLFFLLFANLIFACTDFVVKAKDGSLINGRSLEFALDLKSEIRIFPRNQKVISMGPNQRPGISWVSKFGYLGVNCLGLNFSFDGMNEAGLSVGYLWLPSITEYPSVEPQEIKKTLDFVDFCAWALGNFSTVEEVKEALESVRIWGHPVPPLGVTPVHFALHDAKGDNLVIEFVGGQMQVYDNPLSILTNTPAFNWHIANLNNYLTLSPYNPLATEFQGMKFEAPGQGSGFLGLPGDWSPPSRFVRIFTLLRFAKETKNATEAVNLAEHMLNSVDIPLGEVRDKGKDTGDYTQWIVIKDLTQKVFYFRSYEDQALKKIEMKHLNFSKEMKNSLPINLKKGYFDVTDAFLKTKMTVNKD